MDGYSPELSEFPFYSKSVNYTAQSLGLTDLKSIILGLLVEQMALADPVRYVWTLRERVAGTPCPAAVTYLVIQRNFDILPSPLNSPAAQTQYSSYVNDVLYSYYIIENCPPSTPLAGDDSISGGSLCADLRPGGVVAHDVSELRLFLHRPDAR